MCRAENNPQKIAINNKPSVCGSKFRYKLFIQTCKKQNDQIYGNIGNLFTKKTGQKLVKIIAEFIKQ